jgi:hypothetical protein
MNEYELINLGRIIEVLEGYGADKDAEESPARKAIDQLKRLCAFKVGQKVFVRSMFSDETEVYPGIVVAYLQHEPMFVVGPGDDRDKLPEDAKMLAFKQGYVYDRGEPPEGVTLAKWEVLLEKKEQRKAVKK